MSNRSTFPEQIDSFKEMFDLPPSKANKARRFQELRQLPMLNASEQEELNGLVLELSSYIITPEHWNKFADALVNVETFFTEEVARYIEEKVGTSDVRNFTFVGTHSTEQEYKMNNMVRANDAIYMATDDVPIGVSVEDESYWHIVTTVAKGETGRTGERGLKGDKGEPFKYSDFTPEQLESLRGAKGDTGLQGIQGIQGEHGEKGDSFQYSDFTEEQLFLLKGEKGERGEKGDSFKYTDFTPEQLALLQGADGKDGTKGEKGDPFKYSDFTPEQLQALKGAKGDMGIQGERGKAFTYSDFTPEQLQSLKGEKGDTGLQGIQGIQGIQGMSVYEIAKKNGFEGTESEWLDQLNISVEGFLKEEQIGIPNGIARLNEDGKVVDSDNNLVDGKVKSVNGHIGEVVLTPSDIGQYPSELIKESTDKNFVTEEQISNFQDKYSKREIDEKINQLITDLDWKETVETVEDLSTTYPEPQVGWTVGVSSTGTTYRWDGESWTDIGITAIPIASESNDGKLSKEGFAKLQNIPNPTSIETKEGSQGKVDTHASNSEIHVTKEKTDSWDLKETPTGAQNKVNIHENKKDIHVTIEDKANWNNKSNFSGNYHDLSGVPENLETVEGSQSKADNAKDVAKEYADKILKEYSDKNKDYISLIPHIEKIDIVGDNQTVFTIPVETFDKDTDFYLIVQNTTVLTPELYSIENRTLTLNEPLSKSDDDILYIVTVGLGITSEEARISANVLKDGSMSLSKLEEEVVIKADYDSAISAINESIADNKTQADEKYDTPTSVQSKIDKGIADYKEEVNQTFITSETANKRIGDTAESTKRYADEKFVTPEIVDSKVSQAITSLSSMNKVKKNVTIDSNKWTLDDITSLYKYVIEDTDITEDSIVDVNIHLSDLDKTDGMKGATESFNGYVQLYAESALADNIVCDYKITMEVK